MAIEDLQKEIEKQQRAKMRQITTRRIKIAQLQAEVEQLQKELNDTVAAVTDYALTVEVRRELELELDEVES